MIPAIAISAFACIGLISALLRKAPEGWEDANGFHFCADDANSQPAATSPISERILVAPRPLSPFAVATK